MQDKLKPCPFCGCQNLSLNGVVSQYVSCSDCYAEGPWNDVSEEEAITAWNTRVDAHLPTTNPVDDRKTPVGDHQMVEAVADAMREYQAANRTWRMEDLAQAALTAARAQVDGESQP